MSMNNEWDVSPRQLADQLVDDLVDVQKQVVLRLYQVIIQRSPIDTGAYRANHRISVGAPDTGADPTLVTPPADVSNVLTTLVPFTTVYVQNNLPYAVPLEDGHSQQAPQGVYMMSRLDVIQEYGA